MVLQIIRNRRRLAQVRQLIQTGYDVNAYDKSGWTPLLRAAYHGHVEVAKGLIKANADVHLKVRESGMTALHNATYYGHQALVKLFLETNININERDDEGKTALLLAVERGHSAVVAELVKAGADTSLKDKKGMTAVLLAKSYNMVHQLARDVDHLSREDRSHILWHACDVGDLSMVQSVIEAGCDADHIHKGQTPVMMATLRGHDSIVKELILANCDVNLHSNGYYSDWASSLTMARMLWSMALLWLVVVSGCWIPWARTDGMINLSTDLLQASMLALAMSVMAVAGVLLVPGEGILMFLGLGVVAMVMIYIVRVVVMAGSVVGAVVEMLMVMVLLIMTSMYREFLKTIAAAVALCICAHLVLQFVRDVPMPGAIILVIAIVAIMCMAQKGMMAAPDRLLVTVLVGGLANAEIYVVSLVCMRIARKVLNLGLNDGLGAWMLELFFTGIITGVPLVVLRTQNAAETIIRGAVVLYGFVATSMYKLEDVFAPLEDVLFGLILVVLAVTRIVADILATITKKSVLLKAVVVVLHLVVAVVEVCLAILLSNEGEELRHWAMYLNLIVVIMMMTPIKATNATALHYAAGHNRVKCGVLLVEAGADMRAKNKRLCTPSEIGSNTFQNEMKQILTFTTKRVIAVIGNTEHGKSTLVAALECTSDILWKKAVNQIKKVHDIRQRTTGIEAVHVSNQKYGEALFYDFAGQSQYHGPHQSFLEAMLSKPGVSMTLLLLVKATEEEDIVTEQLYRWLQPLAVMSIPVTPQVVVVGSFLDQVTSRKEASEKLLRCTQSVKTELCLNIQGPCLLDCRQPESRGIDQICILLQEAHPVNTNTLSYNLHWVLVQVRKAFSIPALRLHEFQTWLQDNARNLPKDLPSPKEVCQDLSAAGHTLFLPNKQHLSHSWLILDLPCLLHDVYMARCSVPPRTRSTHLVSSTAASWLSCFPS